MRWTDAPPQSSAPTVEAWCAARAAHLDAVVLAALAAARAPDALPRVLLESAALDAVWHHVAGSALERGGLLLGTPLRHAADVERPGAVHVRAAVPGLADAATPVSLQLHAGVWDAARSALQPGEVVVGWFHSHPGIGAFFSGTDRRTQAGFFNHAFSLGWVIDPQRRKQAWFVGGDSIELPADAVLPLSVGA